VESLEGVVSNGRVLVGQLRSHIVDYEAQLAEADAELIELRQKATDLQSSLEMKTEQVSTLQSQLDALQQQQRDLQVSSLFLVNDAHLLT